MTTSGVQKTKKAALHLQKARDVERHLGVESHALKTSKDSKVND